MNAKEMLHWVEAIVSVGIVVASIEMFFVRDVLRDDGFLSWRINRLARPGLTNILSGLGLDRMFEWPMVLGLIGARGSSALWVIGTTLAHGDTAMPLLFTALCTIMVTLRGPQGNDGSDQMATILIFATAIGELIGSDFAKSATLMFIAVEAALAYATAGFLKVPMQGWRDGSYVLDVLRTGSFGNAWILARCESVPVLPTIFGLGVAFGDSCVALAALLPTEFCIALLVFGVALHVGIAIVLGLNTFVWSFLATYPATLWASSLIHGL